ncbi:yvmA, partial [Symbiodinium pilosum]
MHEPGLEDPAQSRLLLQILVSKSKNWRLPAGVYKLLVFIAPALVAGYWLHAFMSSKTSRRQKRIGMCPSMLFALGATLLLDFFCTDQYQPSMPDMADDFQVSKVHLGATIQVHLFTSAIFMLIFGPLSDSIGRRPVILACQALLATSTLCCGCAETYPWFIVGRIFQGMAAAATPVVLSTVPDCYADMAERLRYQGSMAVLMQLGPLTAPAAGGFLADAFGWRCPFYLLSGLSCCLLLFSSVVVEESAPPTVDVNYGACARRTLLHRCRCLILIACLFIKSFFDGMAASNGIMLRRDLHLSLRQTSICITLIAASGMLGSYIPSWLPWGPRSCLVASMGPLLLSAACLAFSASRSNSLGWYMAATCFAELVIWTPYVCSLCQFTEGIEEIAGSASSLLTALSFLGSSLASLVVVVLAQGGVFNFLLSLAVTLLLVALSIWLGPLRCAISLRADVDAVK